MFRNFYKGLWRVSGENSKIICLCKTCVQVLREAVLNKILWQKSPDTVGNGLTLRVGFL